MIQVTTSIEIDEREIKEAFIRASGPGGQNVNKVSTAVQLRFNVSRSLSLPEDVRARLIGILGSRLTEGGELVIEAKRFRTRERNRLDARERLAAWIRKAAAKPKTRHKTKPTAGSRKRRLEEKHSRAGIKKMRQRPVNE
ncbi:MAG: alternative ribosome rescue aminoacyl-tRNA hydrolase ArfB [Pseudomonadota bacterium]